MMTRRCVRIIHLDHMNDYRGYTKRLHKWTKQLGLAGVCFLPLHTSPRPRHVFVMLESTHDAMHFNGAEFMRRLRTEHVDKNSRGDPCLERMSSVSPDDISIAVGALSDVVGLEVVETAGTPSPASHFSFVRDWVQAAWKTDDAEKIVSAMDALADSRRRR